MKRPLSPLPGISKKAGTELKGVQKNQTVDIFLCNFYNFQYFTVILRDLGLEVRKYPVKFRNDISTQTREILIQLEGT